MFSNVRVFWSVWALSLAALFVAVPLVSHAQPDSYLCHKAKGKTVLAVGLDDLYDTGGTYEGKVAKLLCAPAENGGPAEDADTHLVSYKVKGPHTKLAALELPDQFGTFTYATKKTDSLMVPAGKTIAPAPAPTGPPLASTVDAYRCMKAKGSPKFPKGTVVSITDQFGTRDVGIKKASRVCVATDIDGVGVNAPDNHLTCYKVKAAPKGKFPGAQTSDAFADLAFDTRGESELCIPSGTYPTSLCPLTFGLSVAARGTGASSDTRIETGVTGLAHYGDVPGGYPFLMDSTCANSEPPCGACAIDGAALATKPGRCANDGSIACDTLDAADADDCGGAICRIHILPPVHGAQASTAVCVERTLNADVSSSIENELGSVSMTLPLTTRIYLGESIVQPCPLCLGDTTSNDATKDGTCSGGDRDGLDCDANGDDPSFGATSLDCPPSPFRNITGVGIATTWDLTTGSVSLPTVAPCDGPFAAMDCFCPDDPSGPVRQPNNCDTLSCVDTGGGVGECAVGPDDFFCDGLTMADGTGIASCFSDGDCTPFGWGTCTIVQRRACFLDPVTATGMESAITPELVATHCIAPTSNNAVNSVFGLEGPERVRLDTTLTRGF